MTDAIVVGAGIVGAACAYYLAREGLSVTVLDADFAGGGTTAAGMGHVVVLDDDPLARYSQHLLGALDPPDVGLDRCGTLWVAETPDQLPTSGGEVLDEQSLRQAEPALRPGLAGALLVRDDFVVYQPALTRWLLAGVAVTEHTRVQRLDELKADVIVNATGAWAPTLTPGLEIIPRKGHLIVTDRVP
ncbi:MAG TPA: FAD-dependent oxidoreductase, partial [Gemmatimonadaceae bacterium]|nr:FAD-dependent oxidoreductase [Gemmatimonadaceae bacterium]